MGSLIPGADRQLEDEPDLVARLKEEKRKFETKYGKWRTEARENYDMVAGDGRQWDAEDRAKLEDAGKPCVEFDRLGTIVDAVSGSEINNRKETNYIPRLPGNVQSQGVGQITTSAAKWVRDNCDAEDEESDSFVDVLITGIGCTLTRMDYEGDEDGQILIERKDPLRLGWDAQSVKRNFSDSKCVWEECEYTKDEIEAKWPDKADEISYGSVETDDDKDELRVVDQQTFYQDKNNPDSGKGTVTVTVTRFQWYEVDQIYKIASPSGVVELPEDRFKIVQQLNPMIQYATTPRRRYMEAFICGNTVLEEGPLCDKASEPAQDFTYQFITGKRDRNRGYWYGLVRPGKDPQRWANKFFSQILHIINTNAKGGVLAETGAVSNVRKFEDDWSKSDAVNWLNPGGLAKIRQKEPAQIPPSLYQGMEFAISSIRDCTGVNLELLGLVDRQQAGVLEQQRTQAGLTILAPFFSNLRLYRKRQGRLLAYFIKEYISDGRLIRVTGPEGEQFMQLFREPMDIDYEMVVDDAPTARDTKEKTWQALMPILQIMQQQGVMPPPEVLDYLPIPTSLAQKIKAAVMQHMQQMAAGNPKQDAMFQADLWDKRAGAEGKEALAAANYTKAGMQGVQLLQALFGPQPMAPQGQSGMPPVPQPGMPGQQMQPGMPGQMPPPMQPPVSPPGAMPPTVQ